jgi:hypothetical protein
MKFSLKSIPICEKCQKEKPIALMKDKDLFEWLCLGCYKELIKKLN